MLVPHERFQDRKPASRPIRICILGSTGSIGLSALQLVREHPEHFEVIALAAGTKVAELSAQILEFKPLYAAIADESKLEELRQQSQAQRGQLSSGDRSIAELACLNEVDVVLAAVVGVQGLVPVLAAIEAGKHVALANKESLVAAGGLVTEALQKPGAGRLLPVDSEHAALFQLLEGRSFSEISELVLTASGGPFFKLPIEEFSRITPQQAVKHPRWNMGAKISIDSATLVNKALELIEAFWLYGVAPNRIQVLVHPQSIVHALVRCHDGCELAHMSVPDMKAAIAYGVCYPHLRLHRVVPQLDLIKSGPLEFYALDEKKFPVVQMARECLTRGGSAAALFNLSNEVAVAAFMAGRIRFDQITEFIQRSLDECEIRDCDTLVELLDYQRNVQERLETWLVSV